MRRLLTPTMRTNFRRCNGGQLRRSFRGARGRPATRAACRPQRIGSPRVRQGYRICPRQNSSRCEIVDDEDSPPDSAMSPLPGGERARVRGSGRLLLNATGTANWYSVIRSGAAPCYRVRVPLTPTLSPTGRGGAPRSRRLQRLQRTLVNAEPNAIALPRAGRGGALHMLACTATPRRLASQRLCQAAAATGADRARCPPTR